MQSAFISCEQQVEILFFHYTCSRAQGQTIVSVTFNISLFRNEMAVYMVTHKLIVVQSNCRHMKRERILKKSQTYQGLAIT